MFLKHAVFYFAQRMREEGKFPPSPPLPPPARSLTLRVLTFLGLLGISVLRVTEIRDNKNPLTGPLH